MIIRQNIFLPETGARNFKKNYLRSSHEKRKMTPTKTEPCAEHWGHPTIDRVCIDREP